ncbi:DUF4126 domain-containing protein [Rudaea sp.]|uniref:DUF4126 domain-containing protein n=1 Tax=Rudaea sp. TaxID=2136325 RepID=UPI00321F9074
MEHLQQLALASGLAWASGIRLYAAIFIVGLMARLGYVHLPADLALLEHNWVLGASAIMLVAEFLADKVPGFDSIWDTVHTFIRIPLGALLAWGAMGDQGPALQMAAAVFGGAIAGSTHLAKAGARAAINTSPEPFTNWTASAGEDGLLLGGLWLVFAHPAAFLVLLALFLLLTIWLLPKVFRYLARIWRRLGGGAGPTSTPRLPSA